MRKLIVTLWLLVAVGCAVHPSYATVSTTSPRNDYVGTGSTATYSYTFKIFTATDLRVTTRDTSDVETTLTYPTDYTVTGAGSASGGTITLTAGNLTSGYALTIRFDRTPRQSTDLRNQGTFYPETHEDKFDELTRYSQQLEDVVDRSIHLPETEAGTAAATTLPAASSRSDKFLAWDSSGNVIAAAGTSGTLGPVSAYIDTLLDDANAATARATLDVPSNAEAVLDTLVDAKGDLLTATAADTPARLAVGSNDTILVADSAQTTGLKWSDKTSWINGQVPFPATQNASADANTLDDYEEGTWPCTVGGTATYTAKTCTYTKVGRKVTAIVDLTINAIGTGSASTISGLPFTASGSANTAVYWGAAAVAPVYVTALVTASGSTVSFYGITAANATLSSMNLMGNSTAVGFTLTYFTN